MLGFACSAACTAGNGRPNAASRAVTRRSALRVGLAAAASAAAAAALPAAPASAALQYGKPSTSDLLHKIDRERPEDEVAAEKASRAEARRARLERQREFAEEAERRRVEGAPARDDVEIEANLRANYYQPTGRKRYLPKIKRASDNLPRVRDAVVGARWLDVGAAVGADGFLDDLVLPMRLYASGLSGQGLSLAAKFVVNMGESADAVDGAVKKLKTAVKKKDEKTAIACLDNIQEAVCISSECLSFSNHLLWQVTMSLTLILSALLVFCADFLFIAFKCSIVIPPVSIYRFPDIVSWANSRAQILE